MNWYAKSFVTSVLTLTVPFLFPSTTAAQNSVITQPPSSVIVLDSTKSQDGLNGSVRRVKTESAKLAVKNGQMVEGPRQLIELTTYDISGKRSENISYPVTSSSVGKEEYKYDERGNMVEMTKRDDAGAILSKETYDYEFDRFGNWTKMVTSLVVFEADELKHEPVEVTYRSLTYYFDDTVAKLASAPPPEKAAASLPPNSQTSLEVAKSTSANVSQYIPEAMGGSHPTTLVSVGEPPAPESKKSATEEASNGLASKGIESNAGASNVVSSTAPTTDKHALELYKTGRDLFDSGDAKGAILAYHQSLQLTPASADIQLSLGQAYLSLKKDKDAAKAFKESILLNADSTEAHYGLGLASFRMGHFRDAADAFKKAAEINPELGKAHYGLALAYQELGNVTGVIDEYRILQRVDGALAKQLARAFPVFDLPCHAGASCK
jgi:TolA-binding protein